ncbi:UvrD-helicase domain-containing protein [Buchnera aphidicola (Aphis craccivore)]|uniref:DNA 3'-5' helicase n=1 Tax=Buchnera aphidicola (Aphis craccivora) TaxID=466616 RepID=A0AA95IZ98_9GAMM|nr:UvrD-helicase domain-containing protein [Buchnera aphidicola]QLL40941.1 UvrD-helicase domain-containing protein [Buchnera aphidicola (Aphis craccivore)]WAI17782.1 MAG: UvrD-helicase domain-containing protein [Buchnera aphidicola (Aphis craccivora)]
MSLNYVQKHAVELINGPCLILAGAGSGKTKVIINKIIYLIKNCQYQPNNIIALTFTNKAAYEIKTRLLEHLNIFEIQRIIISTFHSFGLQIIKKEINFLGLNSNFSLFDEKDQISLLKKITNKKIKNDTKLLKNLIFTISYWKNKFYTPLDVELLSKSSQEKDFAYYYKKYTIHLRESNILDFDDLICIPILLFKKNKIIKHRWQEKITYLLVDEYQDTSNSQYELIKMLTNKRSNFTLVGDDDQSIYSWRGATTQNIFLLKKDFPTLKIIKMEQNYRSYGRILKVANKLISYNPNYFQKKLFSKLKYGNKINIIIAKNEEIEAEKIAQKIICQCSQNKLEYRDYAILYRGNYQSQILEKIFLKRNIPYNISNNSSFFSRPEIKDLLSYLRLIINHNDNYAFSKVLNTPCRRIGITTLNKIEEFAIKKKISFFQVIDDPEIKNFLRISTVNKIKKFISWIKKVTLLSISQPSNILDIIIHDTAYESWLSKNLKESDKIKNSTNNIYMLSNWIKSLIKGNNFEKPMSLLEIITKMTLRDIINNEKPKDSNQVQLMTLHSSKGLEFSSVFIIGMSEGILPNIRSINENNIEEERRLAYVGITRAKKQLFLTYCETRMQYGQKLYTVPSRFLFELPEEDLHWDQDVILTNSTRNIKYNIKKINDLKQKIKIKK